VTPGRNEAECFILGDMCAAAYGLGLRDTSVGWTDQSQSRSRQIPGAHYIGSDQESLKKSADFDARFVAGRQEVKEGELIRSGSIAMET